VSVTQEQARQQIRQLIEKYRHLTDGERKALSEANVVHQFIVPLLDALGWPVQDPARYKYELQTVAGRPDMTLIPESGGVIFVEAKRFGAIDELRESRQSISGVVAPGQLALPGMAADRTPQEQQAINYAFQNGGSWAILTNFERLRLFNARRDWLVLSFDRPGAFLTEFDLLWQLSYAQVCQGGLDALSSQRHRGEVDTAYLNFINTWRERLAQDIIARPAANPWAFAADGAIRLAELRAVVQRILDRLVVVRFAEDHLIVPPGTLQQVYELRKNNPYTFPLHQHFAQLFRIFDQKHNSALFAPDLADQAVIGDEVLLPLTEKLYEARYRALSADIMGNTYEQYLGKTLVQVGGQVLTRDNLETRKKQGSYYTPQVIVRYLVDNSLGRYLYGTANGQPAGDPLPDEPRKTAADIRQLRMIDPACGSGSFLIYAYQVLADFYRSEIRRLEQERNEEYRRLVGQGVTTPFELQMALTPWSAELDRLQHYPRLILETHLYGVDLDPQAAEIATVNLMMRAMADQPQHKRRLPLILNQNVKVGNALIGAGPTDARLAQHTTELAELRRLRLHLAASHNGDNHDETLRRIQEITTHVNATLDATLQSHFADMAAHRPLNWVVEFPEVFLGEEGAPGDAQRGFQIVVGNPPWEIVKPDLREYYAQFDARIESKLTRSQVETRIAELDADPAIAAGWQAQTARIEREAAYFGRSADYTRQGKGDRATHKLFLERGYALLAHGGRLGFLIPSGIYTDLGTKPLRELLLTEGRIEYLFSFSNERFFFADVHHSFKFTLLGAQKGVPSDGFWATFRFNPRVAVRPDDLPAFLADPANLVYINLDSLARFSPDSLSVMEFQSQEDSDITSKLYRDWPLLGEAIEGCWSLRLNREFDMTNDRHLFNQNGDGLRLYEGKMIHQYNAFYSEAQYWVADTKAEQHFRRKKSEKGALDYQIPRLGFREIARPTDSRTLIAAIIPPNSCCNHKISVAAPHLSNISFMEMLFVLGIINSFIIDYLVRFKISTSVGMFHFYQLPVPRLTAGAPFFDAIVPRAARLTCTRSEFADLWQAVIGEPWDERKAATDPVERQQLRDELDALIAHLYGLSRAEFAHILGAFPLVFPNDAAGEAKKAALLRVYDRFGREGIH
jgi:hypothetical protein